MRGGGGTLLSEVAALRGQVKNFKRSQSETASETTALTDTVADLTAALSAQTASLAASQTSEAAAVSRLAEAGGGALSELRAEKDALLDYVAESLDGVAEVEERNKALKEEVVELGEVRERKEELEEEKASLAAVVEELKVTINDLEESLEKRGEAVEAQKAEMDEMARMQIELLEAVKRADDEKTQVAEESSGLREALDTEGGELKACRLNLRATNGTLNQANSSLAAANSKLTSVLPKLDSADAELRVLRARLKELEGVEEKRDGMEEELGRLRLVNVRVEAVAEDLRGGGGGAASALSKAASLSKADWHSSWANAGSLSLLLPSLGDRVQTLFADAAVLESQLGDVTRLLSGERKDRDGERRSLSDELAGKERDVKDLESSAAALSDSVADLRARNSRAKGAEAAASQLRILWLSHCQEDSAAGADESDVTDVEVVHGVARALYAGRQASGRASQTLQKLVESEAMIGMRTQEVHRLRAESEDTRGQLAALRAGSEAEAAGMRSEGAALAAELESAAELAERQGALAVTLEGRLEALAAERSAASQQHQAARAELDGAGADLREALGRASERGRGAITAADGIDVRPNATAGDVVRCAVRAMDVLGIRAAEAAERLAEARARAEMSEVGNLARANTRTPHGGGGGTELVGTPRARAPSPAGSAAGSAAGSETGDLVTRQKLQVGAMQQKWGLSGEGAEASTPAAGRSALFTRRAEQQQRIDNITRSAASVRTAGGTSSARTPQVSNREGGRGEGGGESEGGGMKRAPSPGTRLLQERLKKAQAAFAGLERKN